MSNSENTQKVSYLVFLCTLVVVLLTLIPVIFPALFSSYFGLFTENLNSFELGYLAVFLIVSNVVIFGFGIAYYKKKIPSLVYDAVEKIRTFEISKRVAVISLAVILCVYVGLSTPELFLDEGKEWSDYHKVLLPALEIWPFGDCEINDSAECVYIQEQNDRYVRMFFA